MTELPPDVPPAAVPEPEWRLRAAAHAERVDPWVEPVLERRRRGEAHPVEDFLFTYYSQRPARLRRWSPGAGVVLAAADPAALPDVAEWQAAPGGYRLPAPPQAVARTAGWVAGLLERTAGRPAQFGCFGLHEWAMVHRQPAEQVRHAQWPLRLGAEGTSDVVEALPIRCSHFDAFRFFTPAARPLNQLQPTRQTQPDLEQGGCLHANMDLYKWAYKLFPWVPAELVADCFELARRVRELDMRASPYDLSGLGHEPVPIETPAGRADYAARQRGFAAEAAALRARLLSAAERVTGA
ncbi:3-methyladenine DNA glycosylase [Motilibacter aurantiacus]|uniref:3-methyladenine DNA glycosylase n=1 Tax=Motilibacter aurantiacus TaxID=2714955 RepID=UPI001408FC6E|nr:3-methyladenine DNA glycosylase [Motilibacter aurantiacus]NHC43892.1 3-methyladenine DNA glycosylase [Motilibacter aurantiacus]